jgi:hypothetical protein
MIRLVAAIAVSLVVVAVAGASEFVLPAGGKVYFKNLKDGDTVPATLKLQFGLDDLKTRAAGEDIFDRRSGHHHLIVDGAAIGAGKPVPLDARHLHFGKGQTEAEITLKPGTHTLTMQFADGAHRSYGEKWAQTITVVVR